MTAVVPAETTPLTKGIAVLGAYLALVCAYLAGVGGESFVDPDAWHQMALFREARLLGALPLTDPFSYTSTVDPVVHHEWGMGAVLFLIAGRFGPVGLGVLRDLLALGAVIPWLLHARSRRVSHPVLWMSLPLPIALLWTGLSTVRAQMFTLLFASWLLWFLALDRQGKRWWILAWLPLYLAWVNLHAGFVVGVIALGLHTIEQVVRRRPVWHLVAVLGAMSVLTAINPYGIDYFAYLWEALRMERPLITEWRSIVEAQRELIVVYVFSILLLGYGLLRGNRRELAEGLFLAAAAYAGARHQRHLTIYAVAWGFSAPALLQTTPLGALLTRTLDPARRRVAVGVAFACVLGLSLFVGRHRFRAGVPANPGDHATLLYPVGAVQYMRENGFRGNLLTPFEVGAFVSWKMYPDVKVSLDGRFEVAFAPELLERHLHFYGAGEGWPAFLDELPTDAVLVRSDAPVATELGRRPGWRRVYRDDAFELFARDAVAPLLPSADQRGVHFTGEFP